MRALLTGWFSFVDMGATAGDLLVRDLVREWLDEAGVSHDVAHAAPFGDGVRWEMVDPHAYTHLIFVCGPFGNGPPVDAMLDRFASCNLIGVDLSMLDPLDEWNPFELLLERDSDRTSRPDFALIAPAPLVPVVGIILIHPQPEYGERDLHQRANETIESVVAARACARLRIDTRLDLDNEAGLRTPAEVVALIAKADVVVTTRLHGLVLALRSGVPAVAVDPVAGGAKISRQAAALGWPWCFSADVNPTTLVAAIDVCLEPAARALAHDVMSQATRALEDAHGMFLRAFRAAAPRGGEA